MCIELNENETLDLSHLDLPDSGLDDDLDDLDLKDDASPEQVGANKKPASGSRKKPDVKPAEADAEHEK